VGRQGPLSCYLRRRIVGRVDEMPLWCPTIGALGRVWTDRDAHAGSLDLPGVRDVIGRARPIIADMAERIELIPTGGKGLPA
jgi:hypothetical protein